MFDNIKKKIYKKYNPIKYAQSMGVKIGENCEFQNDIFWGSEPYLIKIGNNVRITKGTKFVTHDGGVHVLRNIYENEKNIDVFGKIEIGNNVHIGFDTIIMPNVKIGNNCIIACGAVVTKNVEDNTIVAGVPARKIESLDEYYEKVKNKCDYTKHFTKIEKKKYLFEKYNIN